MARRTLNECAYCAEELKVDHGIIGKNRKVYCSDVCVEKGEALSKRERQQLMSVATTTRTYALPDKSVRPSRTLL